MPNKDQTGPRGEGPMTGRKMGKCASNNSNAKGLFRRFGRGNNMRGQNDRRI